MNLHYKRLPSGFHFVKDLDAAHLFAQWPVHVRLCDYAGISHNGSTPDRLARFATAAQALATAEELRRDELRDGGAVYVRESA